MGSQLSHFRLTALADEGGMAAVYRAENTRLQVILDSPALAPRGSTRDGA